MPCNASYARFIFGKFFTSTIILYILLFAQHFYSCKKWVLQESPSESESSEGDEEDNEGEIISSPHSLPPRISPTR
jgi:hypothetical protein